MKKFNPESENVVDYLRSLNNFEVDSDLDELMSTDDLDKRMDLCDSIITTLQFQFGEESNEDWFFDMEEELKDIVMS